MTSNLSFPVAGCGGTLKFKAFTAIEPGAILYSSWGYDQTNIDFYKVLEIKNGFAKVQKVENIHIGETEGFSMSAKVVPGFKAEGAIIRRKIKGNYLKIESYAFASPWDGRPRTATYYA